MEKRRRLELYVSVALSPESLRGALGYGNEAPAKGFRIMGRLTENDGLALAPILGLKDQTQVVEDMANILGRDAMFMTNTLQELAKLHDYYPGIPQVYAEFEDLTSSLGYWVAVPGTIEMLVPTRNSNEQILPKHPPRIDKILTLKRSDLLAANDYDLTYRVYELPVVSINSDEVAQIKMSEYRMQAIAAQWSTDLLSCWQKGGCVLLFNRDCITDAALDSYHISNTEAVAIIDFWIGKGVFRQEGKWLIPLELIMSCACDHEVEVDIAWTCHVSGYHTSLSFA